MPAPAMPIAEHEEQATPPGEADAPPAGMAGSRRFDRCVGEDERCRHRNPVSRNRIAEIVWPFRRQEQRIRRFRLDNGRRQAKRAPHALPRSGTRRPWNVRHNYVLDVIDHRFDRIEESMVFGRAPVRAVTSA